NHFLIRAMINEQIVIRSYTPIKISSEYFDLLINVYLKNTYPNYPNGGLMSQHMDELHIGDCIEVKGPLGVFTYNGYGQYQIKNGTKETLHKCKKISLICGGSDEIAICDKRFKVYYTLDDPPNDWPYVKGYISKAIIHKRLHAPMKDSQSIVLTCGPQPMLDFACIQNLKKVGFK
ncbi:1142_t:CDS:2, partial [Dentiscutata erythropus]